MTNYNIKEKIGDLYETLTDRQTVMKLSLGGLLIISALNVAAQLGTQIYEKSIYKKAKMEHIDSNQNGTISSHEVEVFKKKLLLQNKLDYIQGQTPSHPDGSKVGFDELETMVRNYDPK